MPRNRKSTKSLAEMADAHEEVTHTAAAPRASHLRVVKEFDLRAAHQAWKERHGIDEG
jgi:hypothetical protein